jgi:hypothetical protein
LRTNTGPEYLAISSAFFLYWGGLSEYLSCLHEGFQPLAEHDFFRSVRQTKVKKILAIGYTYHTGQICKSELYLIKLRNKRGRKCIQREKWMCLAVVTWDPLNMKDSDSDDVDNVLDFIQNNMQKRKFLRPFQNPRCNKRCMQNCGLPKLIFSK